MKKLIFIADINFKASPRVRDRLMTEVVDDYAERYKKREKLPPPVLALVDDGVLVCVDGMHRIHALKKNGQKAVECEVMKCTPEMALREALGSNRTHGLRRSNDDKRRCVDAALMQWPDKSNLAIAQLVGVDDKTVAVIRKEMEKSGHLDKEVVRKDTKDRTIKPRESRPDGDPVDCTGCVIPKEIRGTWEEADSVGMELENSVMSAKSALTAAQKDNDILFAEVNFSAAIGDLEKAWKAVQAVSPYAVCPTCNGFPSLQPKGCGMCKGRGFISKFRWDTVVPADLKKIRKKSAAEQKEVG
jgi:hypothetical protein